MSLSLGLASRRCRCLCRRRYRLDYVTEPGFLFAVVRWSSPPLLSLLLLSRSAPQHVSYTCCSLARHEPANRTERGHSSSRRGFGVSLRQFGGFEVKTPPLDLDSS
ncbi:hypothetical protein GW17_00027752 [Ensete ventricosum]|nr:hypothetical protein GW17_00027752 [Ensete ventricosum]